MGVVSLGGTLVALALETKLSGCVAAVGGMLQARLPLAGDNSRSFLSTTEVKTGDNSGTSLSTAELKGDNSRTSLSTDELGTGVRLSSSKRPSL